MTDPSFDIDVLEPDNLRELITSFDANQHKLYEAAARATVRLEKGGHATLVCYKNKLWLITPAHCCRKNKVTHGNSAKVSRLYQEEARPPDPEFGAMSVFIGYGFLWKEKAEIDFGPERVFLNVGFDLAAIRLNKVPKIIPPLQIAERTPEPQEPVMSLRTRPVTWRLPKKAGGESEGEILIPNAGHKMPGMREALTDRRYSFAGYPGESGKPVINRQGKLVGLIRGCPNDKTKQIYSSVIDQELIRGFLNDMIPMM